MKRFFNIAALVCVCSFSLMFFSSPLLCQPWAPPYSPAPYYSSPPINININMSGYPGSYMGYYPYQPGYQPYPPFGSIYPTAELLLYCSSADGDYIYVSYENMARTGLGGSGETGLAIFEASGSDDYDYVSHMALFSGSGPVVPTPVGIAVLDDLVVIGASHGALYLVDVSDKDDPERINTLTIGEGDSVYDYGDAGTLAVKDDVLFVGMGEGVMGEDAEATIYAYDISDPDDTDEDDDLLDSYTIDDFDIHVMVIDSGYLYVAGNEYDDEPSILIFDISDPDHLSLEETFTDLDGDDYSRVNLAVHGDYLLATVTLDQDSSDYDDHGCKLNIINISDPLNPALVYSSGKLEGVQFTEHKHIAFSGDHVFLTTTTGDFGNWKAAGAWWLHEDEELFQCKVYVFDVSDPANADQVEISGKYGGVARGLYVVDSDRLCLHTDTELKVFDISDPTDLSLEETVDIYDIMEDELGPLPQYHSSYPTFSPAYAYPTSVSPGYRYSSYYGTPFNSGPGYSTYTGFMQPPGGYYNYGPGYGQPPYGGSGFYGSGYSYGPPSYSYGPPAYNYGPPSYNYGPPAYSYGQPPFDNGWWNSGPRNALLYNEFQYQNYGTYDPYLSSSFGPPPYSNRWWFR